MIFDPSTRVLGHLLYATAKLPHHLSPLREPSLRHRLLSRHTFAMLPPSKTTDSLESNKSWSWLPPVLICQAVIPVKQQRSASHNEEMEHANHSIRLALLFSESRMSP